MDWFKIPTAVLQSPEFVGCSPVERATWLCLHGHCAVQENGGRIAGCRNWGGRRWLGTAQVTAEEVQRECELWSWDGDDLLVNFYDREGQQRCQVLRARGSSGGKKRAANQRAKQMVEAPATPDADDDASTGKEGKEGEEGEAVEVRDVPRETSTAPAYRYMMAYNLDTDERLMFVATAQDLSLTEAEMKWVLKVARALRQRRSKQAGYDQPGKPVVPFWSDFREAVSELVKSRRSAREEPQ